MLTAKLKTYFIGKRTWAISSFNEFPYLAITLSVRVIAAYLKRGSALRGLYKFGVRPLQGCVGSLYVSRRGGIEMSRYDGEGGGPFLVNQVAPRGCVHMLLAVYLRSS